MRVDLLSNLRNLNGYNYIILLLLTFVNILPLAKKQPHTLLCGAFYTSLIHSVQEFSFGPVDDGRSLNL